MKQTFFQRNCPICNKVIFYSTKYTIKNAEKKNSCCKSCGVKSYITTEVKQKMSEKFKGNKNPMFGMYGEKNPFYGKKHTEDSKRKMILNRDFSIYKTDEFRKKISILSSGKNNPMYGKTFFEKWVEKYGIDVANEKLKEYREKQSKNNSGEKNRMFGKPSPSGSGNGWSGWYNGWFFRSLMELSYMINIIEKYNLPWKNAECDEYSIEYINYNGKKRTYRADFVIADKYLIEIKPKKLVSSLSVQQKKKYAEDFCNKNGMIYKIRQVPKMKTQEIKELINSGKIILTERYKKKFNNLNDPI